MKNWIEISIPYLHGKEKEYLIQCIETNFVSSVGPFISKFENKIGNLIGLKKEHTVATSAGTTALQLGLIANGVKPGDLVIIPTYTFIATANAVSHLGAKPWLFDINKDNLTIDTEKIIQELKENTFEKNNKRYHREFNKRVSAIIPVFTFGNPPNMTVLNQISKEFSIPIIADAACAIGTTYKGKKLGDICDSGIFSFNGNKTITTGAGGLFFSKDIDIVKKVKHLSSTAKSSNNYDHDEVGFNFRMSNIQAAVGLAQIENLDLIIKNKNKIFLNYLNAFDKNKFFELLQDKKFGGGSKWINALILKNDSIKKFDELIFHLNEDKIRVKPFWKPMHLQKPYQKCLKSDLNQADLIHKKLLPLPSSACLTDSEQKRVIKSIQSFFYA